MFLISIFKLNESCLVLEHLFEELQRSKIPQLCGQSIGM